VEPVPIASVTPLGTSSSAASAAAAICLSIRRIERPVRE